MCSILNNCVNVSETPALKSAINLKIKAVKKTPNNIYFFFKDTKVIEKSFQKEPTHNVAEHKVSFQN